MIIVATEKGNKMSKRYFIAEWEIDNDNPDYFPSYIKINNGQLTLLSEVHNTDVEPVRHGWWGKWDAVYANGAACSECGRSVGLHEIGYYHYCPYCGAKMDKEQEHE